MQATQKICFGTLALGSNYRNLAKQLAEDLRQYSSHTPLLLLTDKPSEFANLTNVLAFKHRQQSVGCYHDKRFVIAKALEFFDGCIFIDADMRILDYIPIDLQWQPGITAYKIWTNIPKHNKNKFEINLLQKMAKKLDVDLSQVSFIHECLFVTVKEEGKEQEFLKIWDKIAPFFEFYGFIRGEGHSIGISAYKSNLSIRRDSLESIVFFKDKFEISKAKKNKSNSSNLNEFLKLQKKLEYPQLTIFQKILKKSIRLYTKLICQGKNTVKILTNLNFYF